MLRKIWAIAYVNLYQTFTDRNLILIMIVTPLVLATIISLAFGNLGGGSAPIQNIPVAIVNLDEGASGFNGGQIMVEAFVPPDGEPGAPASQMLDCPETEAAASTAPAMSLTDLTDAVLLDDAAAAKAGVDEGSYAAAIIIPADFSQKMSYSLADRQVEVSSIEVYGSSASPISASIIRSVVEGFANQLLTGFVAAQATIETVGQQFGLAGMGAAAANLSQAIACASGRTIVSIEQQTVEGEQADFNPLVLFGSAQAVFFALFTANATAATILEERRNGTLQRMVISPTPRVMILFGKLVGTFLIVLVQLLFLFIGFTVIGSLLEGRFQSIWGDNIIAIALMLVATTAGTAGVGMITAAVGKTAEQANIIGSIVSILMGILGGAFFAVNALGDFEFLTRLSVVRWGSEGFSKLAGGDANILTNVIFLAILGALFFGISLLIFNRRKDV